MIPRNRINTLWWIFICSFIYAILAMAISREIIIPRFIQTSVDGNIQGDPYYYHLLALEKLEAIKALGIFEFELRPKGQGPAGVASFAYFVYENAYSVVFINAILHGFSVVLMALILLQWFAFRTTLIAILPFLISPHMIIWLSQVNKESFTLAGVFLFLYGLIRLIRAAEGQLLYNGWIFFLSIVTGIGFIWSMRPYLNQILLPIVVIILIFDFIYKYKNHYYSPRGLAVFAIYGIVVITCLGVLNRGAASDETLDAINRYVIVNNGGNQEVSERCLEKIDNNNWRNEGFLPDYINRKLKAMMGQRCLIFTILNYTNENKTTLNSIVDADKLPAGSLDALNYIPRAMLLGVLSPWPKSWGFIFEYRPSFFYTIVPLEAIMLYAGIIGISLWILHSRQWTILIPIGMSVGVMTVYAMATPYLGALYRYRYPWWMLLICLGIGASIECIWRKPLQ